MVDSQERKIPILILVGDADPARSAAEPTRDALEELGYDVEVRLVHGIDHRYHPGSRYLTDAAWNFLGNQALQYPTYFQRASVNSVRRAPAYSRLKTT